MDRGRGGQAQVLTFVLLGGILIAGVSAAYLWAIPMFNKHQDIGKARNALDDIRTLSGDITDIAQEGGSRSTTVRLGDGSLFIDAADDQITYRATTQGAYVATDDWVPLNEKDMQGVAEAGFGDGFGVRGLDKPGVLIGRATQRSGGFLTSYKIVFRPLHDPTSGQTFQIDLESSGRQDVTKGSHTVTFRRTDVVTVPEGGVDNGPLRRVKIDMRVS